MLTGSGPPGDQSQSVQAMAIVAGVGRSGGSAVAALRADARGIQQCVQRLLHRRPHHLVKLRLNAPFVNLHYRPQCRLAPVSGPTPASTLAPWSSSQSPRSACLYQPNRLQLTSTVRKMAYLIGKGFPPRIRNGVGIYDIPGWLE